MARKSKTKNKTFDLDINIHAKQEEPQQKKKFHHKDLIQYQPLTDTQKRLFDTFNNTNKNLALIGSAGTGKTFSALFLSLNSLLSKDLYSKIVVVRSVVPSRDMGFLPGSEEEKSQVYELPYHNICDEMFVFTKSYESLKKIGRIEFLTSSFLRGSTFNDCIVIVDEIQNMNWEELYTVVTRIGNNSRIILCGDIKQNDLHRSKHDNSGFDKFISVLEKIPEHFEVLEFDHNDIVRSELVKQFIINSEL